MIKRFLAVALVLAVARDASAQRQNVRVENTLSIMRRDETIALAWSAAVGRVTDPVTGKEIQSQVLDSNADGRADSLLFQLTLAEGEVRTVVVEAAASTSKVTPRVHAKFVAEREDVAWESDRVAFRIYGKKLWELENLHTNGIDVWTKRTRKLVLDAWYDKGHDGYHVDVGEGADFFQVGESLGGGGTAIWRNNQIYRGDNFLEHRIIVDGPIRAIFELNYGAIDAAGVKATERKRVSIDAGQYFFRQESTYTTAEKGGLEIAVGLVKRPGMVGSTSKVRGWSWVTTWAPIEPRTHGHGLLGTAVLIDKKSMVDLKETDDHYLAIGRAMPGQAMVSYVGSGWTSSGDFRSAEDWWAEVDNFAQRLSSPVKVSIEAAK
ncbi:MAG TPA: DUF4861 family protein [Longimicrobiales bacterium]|nr:DUF4861 family protein [Longimicrobiales bacterium]